jgi:hypothetical protein
MQFLSHLCALASFLQSLQSFLPQFAEAVFAANNSTDANNTVANFFMILFLYFLLIQKILSAIYAIHSKWTILLP